MMKVCVYAICKNEAQFVDRWMDCMGEADLVVVLDTGSDDDSVERLRRRGAQVWQEVISPWRFDRARNRSLELVPEDVDICVCTDLDEVFRPGWRAALERGWTQEACQGRYRYTWSFEEDGREGCVFWIEKIHARRGFVWKGPVHEVLCPTGEVKGRSVWLEGVQLDHHPDPEKSRGQYLPLLELAVEEEPQDDRSRHYLGREYLYHGRWEDCIRTLKEHLSLPGAVWADERSASMRYIARAYWAKGEREQAHGWYLRGILEAPHLREGYLELARLLYEQEQWEGVLYFTGLGLRITQRPRTYISEASSWGSLPHDLRAMAYYHTGRILPALEQARIALSLAPGEVRLQENVKVLEGLAQGEGSPL